MCAAANYLCRGSSNRPHLLTILAGFKATLPRSLEQSCSAPPLFSPDWRPCTCIYVCIQIEYVKLSKFLHSYTYSLQLYLKF